MKEVLSLKRTGKKLLALFLAICLCIPFIGTQAEAAELFPGHNLKWYGSSDGTLIVYWYDYNVSSTNATLGAQITNGQYYWSSASYTNCSLANSRLSQDSSRKGKITHMIPTTNWWDSNVAAYVDEDSRAYGYTMVYDTNGTRIQQGNAGATTGIINLATIFYNPYPDQYVILTNGRAFTTVNYRC